MSRFVVVGLLIVFVIGCSDKQKEADRLAADMKAQQTKVSDSAKDTLATGSRAAIVDSLSAQAGAQSESTLTTVTESSTSPTTAQTEQAQPNEPPVQVDTPSSVKEPILEQPAKATDTTSAAESIMPPRPVDDGYVVQIASTVNADEAKEITARFAGYGYPAFPQAAQVNGTVWYRVRVGPYPTTREATAVLQELTEKYQVQGWVAKHK